MLLISLSFLISFSLQNVHSVRRIYGGKIAKIGQYPYQTLLLIKDNLDQDVRCGGSVIDEHWIITAAHCLENASSAMVAIGMVNWDARPVFLETVDQTNMFTHPEYESIGTKNDIALLKLNKKIYFDDEVSPISLPSADDAEISLTGIYAETAGWGQISPDDTRPESHLRYIRQPIISTEECKEYSPYVCDTNICLSKIGRHSACYGDSGGSLAIEKNGEKILVGIVSFGISDRCDSHEPEVYTKVASYLNWIKSTIQNSSDT